MPSDEALSKVHRTVPATILLFADLHPEPGSTLATRDAPFLRIISQPLLGLPATAKGLITEDVTRLKTLDGQSTAAVAALLSLAANDSYSATVKEIERNFGDTSLWSDDARDIFVPSTATPELLQATPKAAHRRTAFVDHRL